jgi:hypothetical protein
MSQTQPSGSLRGVVIPAPIQRPAIKNVGDALFYGGGRLRKHWFGRGDGPRLDWQDSNAENFRRSLEDQAMVDDSPIIKAIGYLWLAKIDRQGRRLDLGLASCRVVTTAGVGFIVDAFQGLVEPEIMKYHGVGTGGAAEAVGNTALTTELTTQYSVASTRPTGSLGELSGNPNTFETAATITVSATVALTEHGIFSQAAAYCWTGHCSPPSTS